MADPIWTIMLYLSGDNNLSAEMVRAINDIGTEGVPEQVAFTIQYDALSPNSPTFRYALPPGRSFELKPHSGPIPLADAVEDELLDEDSANPAVLADFIRWSARRFDSRHRLLILSGHGSGAVGDFLPDDNARRRQPGSLSIPSLAHALTLAADALKPTGKLVDILGMDSCLMGMVEVACEVQDHVGFLVGSEGFVPNAGWPYGHLLRCLKQRVRKQDPLEPRDVSGWIVHDYLEFYNSYLPAAVSVDIAACDLSKLDQLQWAVGKLTHTLVAPAGNVRPLDDRAVQNIVILAHWRAQSFKFEEHTDLWDFCNELEIEANDRFTHTKDETFMRIAAACRGVKSRISDALSTDGKPRQGFVGVEFQHAHGLSVYFPWSLPLVAEKTYLQPYAALRFARESGWHEFLRRYLVGTMRQERTKGPQLWPRESVVAAVDSAPRANSRFAPEFNRFAPEFNRFAPEFNRHLTQLFGGVLPWSMKNPAQKINVAETYAPTSSDAGPKPEETVKVTQAEESKAVLTRAVGQTD
jgi:hypothetical protein